MTATTQLKNRIMRRVYAVWIIKKVFSPIVIKTAILLAFVWQMAALVSFTNVLANTNSIIDYNFFWHAFLNTEMLTKVLLLGSIVLIALVARDIYKNFSGIFIIKNLKCDTK